MEELKEFIEQIEKDEIALTKENLLIKLKGMYVRLLKDDLTKLLSSMIENIDCTSSAIDLHDIVERYEGNYIAYENNEDFYETHASGYMDAIDQAMNTNHWSINDEYIDEYYETFDEYEFAEKIHDESYSIAKDIINVYIRNEDFRNIFNKLTYVHDIYKHKLEIYRGKLAEINV